MPPPPVVLSIAGYDPSSGAGITADIKTAAAQGCFAITCITALTVQSTQGVFGVQATDAELVARTLSALAEDFDIAAVRVGMLASAGIAAGVADFLKARRLPNVVLDPVIRSSSGAELLDDAGVEVLRTMLPLCDVITPNVDEAALLAREEPFNGPNSWDEAWPRIERLAPKLLALGPKAAAITGGHLHPPHDYLCYGTRCDSAGCSAGAATVIEGEFVDSRSTHGTGCAFAMSLACQLALGQPLPQAVREAKEYVRRSILSAYPLGKGVGPLNHFPEAW